MGDYPVSEKRLLEAVSAREDNPRYFPLVAFDENGARQEYSIAGEKWIDIEMEIYKK